MEAHDVEQIVKLKILECRAEVDERINNVHHDMAQVRTEIHALREDVGRITIATDQMSGSLQSIAISVSALADLGDTWGKFKGFLSVVAWCRANWFLFALLGGMIYGSLYMASKALT